jgi:hypothetical protein
VQLVQLGDPVFNTVTLRDRDRAIGGHDRRRRNRHQPVDFEKGAVGDGALRTAHDLPAPVERLTTLFKWPLLSSSCIHSIQRRMLCCARSGVPIARRCSVSPMRKR